VTGGRKSNALGFTLTEVVVVLALLGIVAAAGVPALRTLAPEDEVTTGAHELLRILRTARAIALREGVPVVLRIDPARRRYLVETESGDAVEAVAQGPVPIPPGIGLSSSGSTVWITFDRLGTAEPDSMAVTGDQGSAVVAVDRWTGEPYVRSAAR
jgi:type II secretion system protein H